MQNQILLFRDQQPPTPQYPRLGLQIRFLGNAVVHSHPTIHLSLLTCPGNLRRDPELRLHVARQHLRFQTGITFSSSLILRVRQRLERRNEYRNIPLHSNVICVRKNSLVPIIFDRIFVLIRMSDLLSVLFVEKHLLASMIARDTKDCIAERRSLSAEVIWGLGVAGAAADDLLEQTPLEDISGARRVGFASNHYSTKKPWTASESTINK